MDIVGLKFQLNYSGPGGGNGNAMKVRPPDASAKHAHSASSALQVDQGLQQRRKFISTYDCGDSTAILPPNSRKDSDTSRRKLIGTVTSGLAQKPFRTF